MIKVGVVGAMGKMGQEVVKAVENGVKFHPGRWLAEYFLRPGLPYITKEEFCHCVMNDLRVTRDQEPISRTIERIENNRKTIL